MHVVMQYYDQNLNRSIMTKINNKQSNSRLLVYKLKPGKPNVLPNFKYSSCFSKPRVFACLWPGAGIVCVKTHNFYEYASHNYQSLYFSDWVADTHAFYVPQISIGE